jgi:hypothetical protein
VKLSPIPIAFRGVRSNITHNDSHLFHDWFRRSEERKKQPTLSEHMARDDYASWVLVALTMRLFVYGALEEAYMTNKKQRVAIDRG